MVCVGHSAFVAVALWRWRRRFALGVAGAVALHWLGNFPISLMAWNAGGLGKTFWMVFTQCFFLLYFLAAIVLLLYFAFHRVMLSWTLVDYRRRHCPECDKDYDAPLLGLNFGATRYERCPHCQHWHWTHARNA